MRPSRCSCRRCRYLPEPKVIGEAHEVAVVLHLDAETAYNVAFMHPPGDMGRSEILDALASWESQRDAMAEGLGIRLAARFT